MIDDSALFHSGTYDPAKARAYYLRTRKLKGRKPGALAKTSTDQGVGTAATATAPSGGDPNRADTKSRRAELQAQKAALQKRLEHLRNVLEQKIAEAKGRSGVKPPKKDPPNAAPETKVDKADRNKAEKAAKPLTAKQKSDKAKQAKDAYEKEHPTSLSQDIEVLQAQVEDIRARIAKAIADASPTPDQADK